MAEKKLSLDLEINKGTADKSVKSIKTELREAKEEAIALARKFGELSPQAIQAASKLAKLKDEMGDLNERVQGLNPDKFARMATLTNGIVRGFQAASGALILFGKTGEDVERAILKLQGVMALADGLEGLKNARKDFASLATQIKGNVVKAFTTLKGAIIATGIGALVVAVGMLVANWEEFIGWMRKSFPEFTKVEKFFKNIKQVAAGVMDGIIQYFKSLAEITMKLWSGDFSGAYSAAKNIGTKVAEAYHKGYDEKDAELKEEAAIKSLDKELQLLEARGKDITKKKIDLLKREQAALDKDSDEYFQKTLEIERLRTAQREKAKAAADKSKAEKEKEREELTEISNWEDDFIKERKEKKIKDAEEALAAKKKAIDDDIALGKKQNDELLASIDLFYEEQKTKANGNKDDILRIEMAKQQAIINSFEKGGKAQIDAMNALAALKAGITKEEYDKRIEDEKKYQDAILSLKESAISAGFELLNALNQTNDDASEAQKKKSFERGKALAIAQTVISTYMAAQLAYQSQLALGAVGDISAPVRAAIAASVAVASGLAKVAVIKKQTYNGGGTSGDNATGGNQQGGGGGFQAASTGFTQIAKPQTNITKTDKQDAKPIKVYVVQKDLDQAKERSDAINAKALVK